MKAAAKSSAPAAKAKSVAASPATAARSAAQPKAAAKTAARPSAKAAPAKPAAKTPAKPADVKATAKSVPASQPAKAVAKAPAPSAKTAVAATPKAAPQAARPVSALKPGQTVTVPAAPGARATKKAMVEQMSQPVTMPSHDPDAPKATFSLSNERAMNTPVHTPVRKDPKLANNWKAKPVEQLSDEEVLAMPDSEYMNDVQLAFFRLKLSRLKADMLANAGETTEHLREDTVVVPDPADRATIEEEHALELRTRDRERKLLKKIEQAIARIDAGDYGYCDETGEAIGVGRLLARPTASLSLEAQQRRELKQKMFGD